MTPKEKAEQLVRKYRGTFFINMNLNDAKQCALIAVDEVIKEILNPIEFNLPRLMFWKEVKKEIEAL
jgi:hypothetical protein